MLRQAQGDSLVEYPKLSAAWVVDEDISRLLKSLPSWTAVKSSLFSPSADQIQTPFAGSSLNGIESEQEIRERTQRESEILIGNLGTQKQLKRTELITSMENLKVGCSYLGNAANQPFNIILNQALACMHETLQWFVGRMRALMGGLSPRARELVKAQIQISTAEGVLVEQVRDNLL
jgi:exocyst complex component 4